jgi:hypothetical protein
MAAPINRNLLFDFKRGADVTPIPLFADRFGWDRLLNRMAHRFERESYEEVASGEK